jgi:ABC-type antimicrobial peptide transport system permease subunit
LTAVLHTALAGLRARRGRALLAAVGVIAASLVVGTAVTVGYGLGTGFERSAEKADLPDVIARFANERRSTVDERVRALPNLQSRSYRTEFNRAPLSAGGNRTRSGALQVVLGGRRGYAIVDGSDLAGRQYEAVIERGLAREWNLDVGDTLRLGRGFPLEVVGVAVSPDNVAFPLAKAARVYVSPQTFDPSDRPRDYHPNLALLWLNDPSRADITLAQARTVSFGIGELSFITREGVKVLLDQAAGVVIALLVAFSLVALVASGTMLAATAHSDVQRRLPAIGVQRALGYAPGQIAVVQGVEAALVAVPAAVAGLALGALVVAGPSAELLATLNELPPGSALLWPLGGSLVAIVALVVASSTWPAWRAARRPPAEILRGGDLTPRSGPTGGRGSGLFALGVRFALAARARWAASVATIAVCAGIVLLMLALASLLVRLRDDPGALGKRYQLTVEADASRLGDIRGVPGVAAAQVRYSVAAADAYRLGEPLKLLAYPGDHTTFEAPPLAEGRRLRGAREAEVGLGLAEVLGLRPGSTLSVGLAGGAEARFRVVGVVRALENEGRMAYVRPDRLLAADPSLSPSVAVRLDPGADKVGVEAALTELGAPPTSVAGAAPDSRAFLGVLATVLRGVGLAVGLVCLYALVQALAVTARERRSAVALLRACGGDRLSVAAVVAGAAAAVVIPAAVIGILLERWVLGPLVARLAAGYAALALAPGAGQVLAMTGGLAALAALATALVARRVLREPVVLGLRGE